MCWMKGFDSKREFAVGHVFRLNCTLYISFGLGGLIENIHHVLKEVEQLLESHASY